MTQNLHVCLSRYQYEQLKESLSYATKILIVNESDTRNDNVTKENVKPSFLKKIRVHFSVPILKLDLQNEHNISLIHLTFEEFSFKHIITNEKSELHVLLRSVLMEDLKCATLSKYRNMVNSLSDAKELNQFVGSKMSISCPDLSKCKNLYAPTTCVSVPYNLQKLPGKGHVPHDSNTKFFRKIDSIHINSNASNENLVMYRSVVEKSPTDNENVKTTSSIDFNCLNLIISTDKWFMVLDFFGLISNQPEKEDEPTQQISSKGK